MKRLEYLSKKRNLSKAEILRKALTYYWKPSEDDNEMPMIRRRLRQKENERERCKDPEYRKRMKLKNQKWAREHPEAIKESKAKNKQKMKLEMHLGKIVLENKTRILKSPERIRDLLEV